jgi:hypothetical protein
MLGCSSPSSQASILSGLVCKLCAASSMDRPAFERAQVRIAGSTSAFVLLRTTISLRPCGPIHAQTQAEIKLLVRKCVKPETALGTIRETRLAMRPSAGLHFQPGEHAIKTIILAGHGASDRRLVYMEV